MVYSQILKIIKLQKKLWHKYTETHFEKKAKRHLDETVYK